MNAPADRFAPLAASSAPQPAASALWGLAVCTLIAALAHVVATLTWAQRHGIGTLSVAIALGLVAGNVLPALARGRFASGLALAKRPVLRAGIVLYGLRITWQELAAIGWQGLVVDVVMLAGTFGLACWLGVRWLKLDARLSMLIGAGAAVCGAAAVLATAPVVRARAQDVAVAMATVVSFGTLAMVLYPMLYHYNAALGAPIATTAEQFGLYIGASVHEVAQVVAAGMAVSPEAAGTAIMAKMLRVMLLAPLLLALAWWLMRADSEQKDAQKNTWVKMQAAGVIPWFAFGFVAVAAIHSLGILPAAVVSAGVALDGWLLAIAMAALGLGTQWQAVRSAGLKPLALAAVLFVWLVLGGLGLTHFVFV